LTWTQEFTLCKGNLCDLGFLALLYRFVNHVSHLATQVTGGAAVPMFQLASRVSIPNWMVEMRHEATHGGNLPSLEPLRLAADFMKTWLHVIAFS